MNLLKYPHVKQHDQRDCGAACLSMISEFYGLKLPIAKFRDLIKVDIQGANIYGIVDGSKKIGLIADALEGTPEDLFKGISNKEITFPFIARIVNDDMFSHFVVVYDINDEQMVIGDPAKEGIRKISTEQFTEQWLGQIITFEKDKNFKSGNLKKGSFTKFLKYIKNQKKIFVLIFILSIIISVINIASSTIFEYILDDATTSSMMSSVETHTDEIGDEELAGNVHEGHVQDDCSDPGCTEDHNVPVEHSDDCSDPGCTDDHSENEYGFITEILQNILIWSQDVFSFVYENVNSISIAVIVLFVLRGILQFIRAIILSFTAKKIEIPLTMDYYDHLIDLPPEFFGTRKTGELMSRFSDTSKIRETISTATVSIMIDSVMAIAVGIYLFTISPILFYIALVIILVYGIIVFLYKKPIKRINHEIMEGNSQVESYLKESIDGIETIKSYQYEETTKNKTRHLFTRNVDKIVKGSIIYASQGTLVSMFASIGTVCLLWVGSHLSMNGVITVGELFMFYYLLSYFINPATQLLDLQPELQTAIVASERLNDILDVETENDSNKKTVESLNGDIKIENVDFRYGNRDLVLKNVSMDIKKGEKVAIIGESGCGKTTLIKLLMSFYEPENGKISIAGNNISEYSPKSVRKSMAYISQNTFLFSDTVANNLKLGNENVSQEELEKACKLSYADKFIEKMPFKYDTLLEENGNDLSAGQKQRLAIARALIKKPDILIMDEATGNLDTLTEHSIKETLDTVSKDMTCIIIAHRLSTIKNCDKIYVMDKGEIVECGNHESLLAKNGMYAKYYNANT